MMARLRHFFFGTLRRQLMSGMMIFCIVVIGVFVTDLTLRQQSFLSEQNIRQATALSQSVAVSAEVWLLSRDIDGLQDIVEAQRQYPELSYAMILDENHMVLAHTDRQYVGQYVKDMPYRPATTLISNRASLIDVASPVIINGKYIGWVRIGLDTSLTMARMSAITGFGIFYGIAALLVAAFIAYWFSAYVTLRIRAIQSVADAVQAGDMGRRVYLTGDDEAATLARQFNIMLDTIASDERQLKYANAYNRSLIEASLDPLVTISPKGKITDVNKATELVTGRTRRELVLTDFSDYFTEPEKAREVYQKVFSEGSVKDYPLAIRHRDGHIIDVLYNASTYRNEAGEILGVFAAARDVTERKMAEERIKQLNDELEEKVRQRTIELETANKELEAFAYSVSHDLRAPLRAIDGFSAVIMEDYSDKLDDDGKEYLQRVRHAAQKMSDLIDDLLSLSRLTRGELHRVEINLSRMADKVIENLREADPARDVDVYIAADMTDEADPGFIEIVLTNLLSNSWKFTSKGDNGKIEFASFEKGGNKVYYIKDNGVGFNMNYSNKLFQPFQRLHTSEEFPGSGIGLATVYRIIRKHGGDIWVESEIGKGATFYFTLKGGAVS